MRTFRTPGEQQVGKEIEQIFSACTDSIEIKLETFPKYVRRQHLKRFLVLYELMKAVLPVKGSIVECGVYRGFGLMAWAKLSAILEPENLTRRIYGFDSFSGLTGVGDQDQSGTSEATEGVLSSDSYDELQQLIKLYDSDRFLGHINKIQLVKGDAVTSIPQFVADNPQVVVSLLFLDFDLYEPTKAAIEHLVPRMPKGAIIAFDELDNPIWPGETLALLETIGISNLALKRLEWDPYVGYAVIQ